MEKFRSVSSAWEQLFPWLYCFFIEHNEEQKDEESLEGIEDDEQDLSSYREGENSKDPVQSKEEHHSTDADHQTYNHLPTHSFVLSSSSAPCVTNQHNNNTDEDYDVENHNCQDWSKKSTPECTRMGQEAAINTEMTVSMPCASLVRSYFKTY